MGESACLLQPFSYTSGFSNEAMEENPVHALSQSISFGRFMSESLDWEKWSTFSNNRYVEEAEKISRPGSVAQKKAFFEAHYKKLAAQKAAALLELEQTNFANGAKSDDEEEANFHGMISSSNDIHERPLDFFRVEADVKMDKFDGSKVEGDEKIAEQVFSTKQSPKPPLDEYPGLEAEVKVEGDETITEHQVFSTSRSPKMAELSSHPVNLSDFNQTPSMERPLLKNFIHEDPAITAKKKTGNSSSKYLHFNRASKIPSSPKQTTPLLHNFATPKQSSKKPAIDSADKRRTTQKSLGFSASFTPIRELHKLTSTVMRKIERSKVGASSVKASKDCSTPLRAPIMPLTREIQKNPPSTPLSEKRSCSKFLSTCKNKATSPFPTTPFSFRTEERAARRKEKLEEKFIANDFLNSQQQTNLKEKAESEIRKLRQTLCFKARPLPDFYKERKELQNEIKKVPLTPYHLESPKLGRKPNPSRGEGAESTKKPSVKTSNGTSSSVKGGKTRSLRSIMTLHENTSPNIQQ